MSLEEIAERQKEDGLLREWGKPDLHLESTADRLLLHSAIAKLSATVRKALLLHDVHGYEHHEIAGLLGKAPGTSKSRVHKARLDLRETLKNLRWVDGQRTVHASVGSNQRVPRKCPAGTALEKSEWSGVNEHKEAAHGKRIRPVDCF